MATISVVIPVFNDAPMLRVCLAALAAQSRPADEIIVVDNDSTDDTTEVGLAGGARVITEQVSGIFPAAAAGYDAARGDIIARLDADSVPPRDWLERIEAALVDTDGLACITGPGDFYGSNRFVRWVARTIYIGGMFVFVGAMLGHPPLFGSNFAMPSRVWQRVRGRVNRSLPHIHDDLDLSYHLEPDMSVIYDPTLRVAVSARPFDSWSALARRLSWVTPTLSKDFSQQRPLPRLRARRAWARQHEADERPRTG
ncbi:glycosyltransferase family 2 protein [Lacisediminihabitans profunda]|uniref:4,4'-diaponeurosporenoate glycosyltransferase n=1 Tax=Lacisediminihabitans profunda TaxID=2594790 RepID=A0A5C8UU40_9MICO|nr:glycosyltransferase family 2 protein [Lacisediminihabitans profunda]TXN31463.1 glycosyltransferase [Lacisediminihabitans profunda]